MSSLRRALSTLTALAVGSALGAAALAAPAHASPSPGPAAAVGSNINENFDTVPVPGWTTINNSAPVGSLTPWFQGTATTSTPSPGPFNAHEGAVNAYAAANFNATTTTGTISGWMITPLITDLSAGDTWSFYTRKPTIGGGQTDYPDRLEVRVSRNGACNPGTTATSVGDFTTVLTSVNPNLVTGVYPQTWTQFSGTIPAGAPASGCLAFRYFVTGAGSQGSNSDYIGVDTFRYTHGDDPVVPDTTLTDVTGAPGSTVTASFTGNPGYAVTGYECSLDGAAYAACTTPLTLTGLAEGSHTLEVRARTAAGTVDPTPASQTFVVDTIKPVANFDSAPSGTLTTDSVTATFSADEPATFECKVDDGDWATCTSPATFTDLSDGEHTIAVRATDAHANTGDSASTTFTVDTTAPSVELTDPPTGTITADSATVAFTSDDPAATFECKVDDGDWATCTSPATFTDLSDGEHTIAVRATDAHANTGDSASTTLTVDTTTPPATEPTTGPAKLTKVKITAPKKARSAKKVKITLTGLTPGAKVTIKLGKKKKTFTVTKTAKGTTKVTVKLKAPKTRKNRTYRITATATLGAQKATTKKKLKVRARR